MNRNRFRQLAADTSSDVISWRRHLHRYPELSYAEAGTAAFVAERLTEMGYEVQRGIGGGYSVVARLQGGRPGPAIALRADMDALPIQEETGLEYTSTRPGIMHACGHDAHTAILLGAAKALRQIQPDVPGTVVFLFQPAEEVPPGGARGMVEAGVLEGVAAVFGMHVGNQVPVGQIAVRPGPVYAAADTFRIRLTGKGGHAATPHLAADPIAMLGPAISGIQHIVSRMVNPLESAVVTIGWVRGGDADNVIPESVEFGGTIRTFDPLLREKVPARLRSVAEGVASMYGGRADVEVTQGYPVLINDDRMTKVAATAASLALGEENVAEALPGMGGEDFAYYAMARPACYARLGTGSPQTATLPVHNPRFVIEEGALEVGVAYYLSLALSAGELVPG